LRHLRVEPAEGETKSTNAWQASLLRMADGPSIKQAILGMAGLLMQRQFNFMLVATQKFDSTPAPFPSGGAFSLTNQALNY
jgi:hypothetical protein